MDKKEEANSKWIDAHPMDPLCGLYTFTQCMALSDISADGDHKLIIADLGTGTYDMKLKVYKGTSLMTENTIIDLPTGIVTFYMDTTEPRTPATAVASGPYIYIYKNLRPYFKFTLPTLDVNQIESDLWKQTQEDRIDVMVLREMLEGLRGEGVPLTNRSMKFLQVAQHDMEPFASIHKHAPLKRQTVITCLGTMKKSQPEDDAISCLVIGTESKNIFVMDTEAFTILSTMELPSVPVFLSITGLYDVEFRIVVACRNGIIYTIKRDCKVDHSYIELNSQPVGLERISKNIVVGCMDDSLHCYTSKSKRLWRIALPASITTMELMDHKQKGFKAVMVALTNCQIHVYRDKYLVNVITCEDVVTAMRFGRFGREESSLVLATKGGGLQIKILKRTAQFEEKDVQAGPPALQNKNLKLPKKTKLFVDQTMREREGAVSMHRQFQHDLYRLRLETARSYAKSLTQSLNPISSNPAEPLKLAAQVQGIGPMFKLTVTLQNTSISSPSINLQITFLYDEKLYSIQKTLIPVPMLVPGLNYGFETFVQCLSDKGISDNIRVFVLKKERSTPLITAVISMPVSETVIVV